MIKKFYKTLSAIPSSILCILSISIIGMNLLAQKSVDTSLSWLGMDAGILFSALSFLAMDIITQSFGLKTANYASVFVLILSLIMSALFSIASALPGVWAAAFNTAGDIEISINNAINSTFKSTWYVIIGSAIAFITSSFLNNFLNHTIGTHLKNKTFGSFALRTYVSTFIAQFTDNIIFALLVSKIFFNWTFLQCITCSLIGAILELLFEVFLSPLGYKITKYFNTNSLDKDNSKIIG